MPETFTPIIWRNNQSPALNDTNLNRVEVGVESIDARAAKLELGIVIPVTVPYTTSVTINATQGSLFRCIASGDLTLDDIVGGTDGQTLVFEVQASGAQRALHFTGLTDSIDIAAGQWWVGVFRYITAPYNTWLFDDGSGGASSGGSGNDLNVLAPQNVPYAATITVDAASGALFRIVAVGDLTLNDPINGTDGQEVVIEVLASGGQRTISFAGGTSSAVAIPTGLRWSAAMRYNATDNVWLLSDATGGSGSGSGSGFTTMSSWSNNAGRPSPVTDGMFGINGSTNKVEFYWSGGWHTITST